MTSALVILERSFRPIDILRALPSGGEPLCGIYMLTDVNEIVYVGSSIDLINRLRGHRTESRSESPHAMKKDFDGAIWYPLPTIVHPFYEGAFIRFLGPKYNVGKPPAGGVYDAEILDGFGLDPESRPNARWRSRRNSPDDASSIARERIRACVAANVRAAGFSVDDIASMTGWHPKRARRILLGGTRITAEHMATLARLLGKSIDDLHREPDASPERTH